MVLQGYLQEVWDYKALGFSFGYPNLRVGLYVGVRTCY